MAGRISQDAVEVLADGTPAARVSQDVVEALVEGTAIARVSQAVVEVAFANTGISRVTQIVLECLIINWEVLMPIIYPKLPGLTFPESWETDFFNTPTQVAASGAEIDLGLSETPLHTFTLAYEFLNDRFGVFEQKLLRGFFGACRGNLGRFLYWLKEDHQVRAQAIGTTDGTTRTYVLKRTYGVGEASWTEPVGYLDQTQTFTVYLDAVPADPSTYTVDVTVPAAQAIIFTSAPAAAKAVTVDMDYFYYCKFKDPKMSLDKFMDALWSGSGIALRSCRAGA